MINLKKEPRVIDTVAEVFYMLNVDTSNYNLQHGISKRFENEFVKLSLSYIFEKHYGYGEYFDNVWLFQNKILDFIYRNEIQNETDITGPMLTLFKLQVLK